MTQHSGTEMAPSLEALPMELIEDIVTSLHLADIASLRLTCRELESKASQGSFRSYFQRKDVQMTTNSLQRMVDATQNSGRACLLQYCTFTGIALDQTSDDASENAENSDLLAQALRNLGHHSPMRSLLKISLRIAARFKGPYGELIEPDKFRSSRVIWETTQRTFNVMITALRAAQTPLYQELDIFRSLRGCSLSCDTFLGLIHNFPVTTLFGPLASMSLSLSAPHASIIQPVGEFNNFDIHREADSNCLHRVLQGIVRLLCSMPSVEELDLHWYHLGRKATSSKFTIPAGSPLVSTSSTGIPKLKLKKCTLRGLYVSEQDLLDFLKAIRPSTLVLTDTFLVSGSYASIFQYLTDHDSPITNYHLDDISQRHDGIDLVHFNVPGLSKFRYRGGDVGPSTLTRGEGNAKEEIRYHFARGWAMGSGARYRWLKSKARDFGALDGTYDFIEQNAPDPEVVDSEEGDEEKQ